MERVICCIDLKSFYASCECILANVDPMNTPLVVVDINRGKNSVVLAVTPYLKKMGVPSRCRLNQLPAIKNMIYAHPKMQYYVDMSIKVVAILLDYFCIEDIHIYSIDESFIDLTPYLKLYQKKPFELCQEILSCIYQKTKITATCGIGPNLFLAKVAMDVEAKKRENGLAMWTYDDVQTKLHPITSLHSIWGIGKNLEKKLNQLHIYSMHDLAYYDLSILEKHFGVIGKELYLHAWGIDEARIQEKNKINQRKSIQLGQTLKRDYTMLEVKNLLKEMTFSLCHQLRKINRVGKRISIRIGYSYKENLPGFSNSQTLPTYTNQEKIIRNHLLKLYEQKINPHAKIRKVSISIGNLLLPEYEAISLFDFKQEKEKKLNEVIDQIIHRFGKNSIFKGTSLLKESTLKERNRLIGGHNAK